MYSNRKRTSTRAPARNPNVRTLRAGRSAVKKASGKGAYTLSSGPWANRGAALGGVIGSHYGGAPGAAIGSWLGRRAFHYPAKLFGSGSYTQVEGGAGVSRMAPQVPQFTRDSSDDSVCIVHREYLGDIITSGTAGAFKIQKFGLNPSEANTFPWLSNMVGPNYQQYRFDGLIFEYKSFSADALNSTNTALGSVFACINYDYSDQDLTSRYEVENTDWASSCKPSEHMMIPVECKPRQTGMNGLLYVLNTNTVPPNTDPKTYYLGKLWLGTTGFQGTNVNVGSLYVTYKVRLYKPVMSPPASFSNMVLRTRTSATVAAPFGISTDTTDLNCDTLGVAINNAGTELRIDQSRLEVGQIYMVDIRYVGNITANLSRPNFSLSSGLQNYNIANGGANNIEESPYPNVNTGSQVLLYTFFLKVTDSNQDAVLTGTATGLLPAACTAYIKILQICGVTPQNLGVYTP